MALEPIAGRVISSPVDIFPSKQSLHAIHLHLNGAPLCCHLAPLSDWSDTWSGRVPLCLAQMPDCFDLLAKMKHDAHFSLPLLPLKLCKPVPVILTCSHTDLLSPAPSHTENTSPRLICVFHPGHNALWRQSWPRPTKVHVYECVCLQMRPNQKNCEHTKGGKLEQNCSVW